MQRFSLSTDGDFPSRQLRLGRFSLSSDEDGLVEILVVVLLTTLLAVLSGSFLF
jgi:hypothetical protein